MIKDITPHQLMELYKEEQLGKVEIDLAPLGRMAIKLPDLHDAVFYDPVKAYETHPDNIESVVLFGSMLYRHFPTQKIVEKQPKYILFGPDIEKVSYAPLRMPNDADIMVITTKPFCHEKVIAPVIDHYDDCWYGPFDLLRSTAVERRHDVRVNEYLVEQLTGANLHVTYRSIDQLLNGIGAGDTVSESVVRYGIPLIGAARLDDIIRDVKVPVREPLHSLKWSKNLLGILNGKII